MSGGQRWLVHVVGWPVAAGVAVVLAASPASAAPPDDAADYLVSQLTDGNHYETQSGPQYGPTIDFGLGLLAAGDQAQTVGDIAAYLTTPDAVSAYVHGGDPTEIYAGAVGKLGFFTSLAGGDPYDVGGEDLIATLQGLEGPDGRFSDVSQYGDYSNTLTQSFGVLSLTAATGVEPSVASVQLLIDAQCDDGSFDLTFTGGGCTGSADFTGAAVQALNATDPGESAELSEDRVAALNAAATWLVENRQPDGSFLLGGLVNVNSTGYGGLGIAGLGLDSTPTADFLASIQLADGGLPMTPAGDRSDPYATAQALPALALDSWLSLVPGVVTAAITVDPPPTSTPTPSVTPTVSPTSTPTGTATPTGTGTPTVTGTPTPSGTLPATGGSAGSLSAAAVGLVVLGGGAVLLAQRALRRT